ncbi:TonB-dependent receptor plug domain-containing protein [bacterium]|nr:TonB-dependent receptor plug domain-containing protein [bacterium]
MTRKILQYMLILSIIVASSISAQVRQREVIGYIQDINTHEYLNDVQISIMGTKIGTITNMRGYFKLQYPIAYRNYEVKIQHIAYESLEIEISSMKKNQTYGLTPRIIPLQGIRIEVEGIHNKLKQDLPQAITILEARTFQGKGYADAADMLKTDHSVQVSESHTGQRQVSIRGGNADETVILYDNIRLNRLYDSRFDLSLIDVDEMARMEVIKGSNTVLYGTGALAGVINIVPQYKRDYLLKFKQSVGSYDAGNWTLQAYKNMGPVDLTLTMKKGATNRKYENVVDKPEFLKNIMTHYQSNLSIRLDRKGENILRFSGMASMFDYENMRLSETLDMDTQLLMGQYNANLPFIGKFETSAAITRQDEIQNYSLNSYIPYRKLSSQTIQYNMEKPISISRFETILAYQFENVDLDYKEKNKVDLLRLQTVPYNLKRVHHGIAVVSKYHAPTGYEYLSTFDYNVSFRRDWVHDTRIDDLSIADSEWTPMWPDDKKYTINTLKFSAHLSGMKDDLMFNAYMNHGSSIKFPSLIQQVSRPQNHSYFENKTLYLLPEKSQSTELGFEVTRQISVDDIMGWQISGNFFKNYYTNKFRYFFVPGIPVAYYDNVRTASIMGIEATGKIFLLNKKFTFGVGVAKYSVSDKAAFPFKFDQKATVDFIYAHNGWQAHAHFFGEGKQVGWIRFYNGGFGELDLPGFINCDFFMGKTIEFMNFKTLITASARNILDTELVVAELPYRDRRFNLSLGIQY